MSAPCGYFKGGQQLLPGGGWLMMTIVESVECLLMGAAQIANFQAMIALLVVLFIFIYLIHIHVLISQNSNATDNILIY